MRFNASTRQNEVLKEPEYLTVSKNEDVRVEIAGDPDTPEEILNKLSGDKSLWVLIKLATNPNLPKNIIEQLSSHPSSWVKANIVTHRKTPKIVVQQMCEEGTESVLEAIAFNPHTSFDIITSVHMLQKASYTAACYIFLGKSSVKKKYLTLFMVNTLSMLYVRQQKPCMLANRNRCTLG